MKLAKRFTGRTKMIAFRNAYHGSTQGALSLMGGDYFKTGYGPLLPDVEILEYNSLNDLERIDAKTACVFAESIQGEAGALPPSSLWMQQLAARCKEQGALLVLDEIQSGFGRTGKFFAFEHYNVVPDIVLMAKGMGGGLPIGAFAASAEIMSCLSQNPVLGHITTFGGNALTAAAAHANLNVLLEEGHIEAIAAKEQLIRAALTADGILGIRGKGLMLAVEFNSNERVLKIMERCYEKGLITDWFLFADHCLRIAPPLIINETQINEACRIINEAVQETQQGK
jgi:acetylornithine/succinyldiaminopimelate/putrescine aminotransferase